MSERPALPRGVPDPALTEYAAGAAVALTDAERWPTLSPSGHARLATITDHPHAPEWVHECGDRLQEEDRHQLVTIGEQLASGAFLPRSARAEHRRQGTLDPTVSSAAPGTALHTPQGSPGAPEPAWLPGLLDRVQRTVPRYRALARRDGYAPAELDAFRPVSRADLMADVASFVPVDVPLDRAFEGSSSGNSGASLVVPLHPLSTATEVVLFTQLAARAGVRWEPVPDRLGLANVVDQRAAFTYASALTAHSEAMMARINLHPSAWRDPADRAAFLNRMNPQVISAAPTPLLSLLALADAGLDLSPLVVFSGAAHLTPAARAAVRERWDVPVIDVYGTREAGLIAADPTGTEPGEVARHVVLPRRIHVEILDAAGNPVPDRSRGEVVVTIDDNPYLPLVRYRTGDTAALRRDQQPDGTWTTTLLGLEGRMPVRYQTGSGAWVPSVDATQVLQAYGLAAWHLHQDAGGAVHLVGLPANGAARRVAEATAALARLLERDVSHTVVADPAELAAGSKRRFTSDLDT